MFDSIKKNIAKKIVLRKAKGFQPAVQSFKNIFQNSRTFFILMPENQNDFKGAVETFKNFEGNGKTFTMFLRDFMLGNLPQKIHKNAVCYGIEEITRLSLPTKQLSEKLASMNFDAVIDLNREENNFLSCVSGLVKSPLRIGIIKPGSDKFYNFQIENSNDNSEIFYKNFLNCLQMF